MHKKKKKKENTIDDFVVFCIFLGNDFLPTLPFFEIDENGLSAIISCYNQRRNTWKHPFLTKDFQIDLGNLRDLLARLAEIENERINEKKPKSAPPKRESQQPPQQSRLPTQQQDVKQIENSLKSILGVGENTNKLAEQNLKNILGIGVETKSNPQQQQQQQPISLNDQLKNLLGVTTKSGKKKKIRLHWP